MDFKKFEKSNLSLVPPVLKELLLRDVLAWAVWSPPRSRNNSTTLSPANWIMSPTH